MKTHRKTRESKRMKKQETVDRRNNVRRINILKTRILEEEKRAQGKAIFIEINSENFLKLNNH